MNLNDIIVLWHDYIFIVSNRCCGAPCVPLLHPPPSFNVCGSGVAQRCCCCWSVLALHCRIAARGADQKSGPPQWGETWLDRVLASCWRVIHLHTYVHIIQPCLLQWGRWGSGHESKLDKTCSDYTLKPLQLHDNWSYWCVIVPCSGVVIFLYSTLSTAESA